MAKLCLVSLLLVSCFFFSPPTEGHSATIQHEDLFLYDGLIIDGTTLLPMRSIFEAFGSTVSWDDTSKTIKAEQDNLTILLKVGSDTALVNNVEMKLPEKVAVYYDLTMVPVRFVAETLGAKVEWDHESQRVYIYNGDLKYTVRAFPPAGSKLDEDGVAYKEHKIQAQEFYDKYAEKYNQMIDLWNKQSTADWNKFHNDFVSLYNNEWAFYYIDAYETMDWVTIASDLQYSLVDFEHFINYYFENDTNLTDRYEKEFTSYKNEIQKQLNQLKHEIANNIIPN